MSGHMIEQVQFFKESGYTKIGKVLSDDELTAVREAADREIALATGVVVMEENAGHSVPRRISKIIQRDELFRRVGAHPIVVDILSALFGSSFEICLNRHNMLMVKAAYHGGQVDWHQDAGSWKCNKLISLMVMLDDATLANGCLQVVPGIHRHPEFQNPDDLLDLSVAKNREMVQHPVPIECKAGEGFLFHSLTPHFSGPNTSSMSRRSLNFAYAASRDRDLVSVNKPLESITIHYDAGVDRE